VNDRGMTLTTAGAEAVLRERISAISATQHITERSARGYIDQDALDGLADGLLDTFSAEAPGSDLMELPRTAALHVPGYGRLIAALSVCVEVYEGHMVVDPDVSGERIHEIAKLITTAGMIQSGHRGGELIFAPAAMFARIERMLSNAADLTDNVGVRRALLADALLAQAGADLDFTDSH
jgi:hypothetical protein